MRNYVKFIIVLFVFLHNFSHAQKQNVFKSDEFKKDIDYLIDTILAQSYPKMDVFNTVSSRNMLEEMNERRNGLSENISHEEFIETVTEILQITSDAHSHIIYGAFLNDVIPFYTEDEVDRLLRFVDTSSSSMALADRHFSKYYSMNKEYRKNMKFGLHVNYINGEYYNLIPVKADNAVIETGSVIKKVNGIDIHQWVNNHLSEYSFILFDKERKRYHTNKFLANYEILNSDIVEITWLTPQNIIKKFEFKVNMSPDFVSNRWITINMAKVKYLKKAKILYVRLFFMDESYAHIEKIRKYGKKKEIERVIVDIRNNPGGNDLIWKEIVEELIDKPIGIDLDVVTKRSPLTSEYFGAQLISEPVNFQGYTYSKFDMRMLESYLPSSTSINFKDKIIVLYNENIFSSAGSFAAVANYSDKFITVGRPCNLPIGVGVTPMFVMLPNTKLLFQFNATIDITNCENYNDLFRDVDVPVEITPKSEYIWRTKNCNRWKWRVLNKYDPYFQKALEVDIKK